MSDANYKIRYRIADFEIEVQGDKSWVEQKFDELKSAVQKMPTLTPSGNQTPSVIPSDNTIHASLVEFIRSKGNPSQNTDRALLFAYWLLKKKNMTSYNISDIQNCYDEARITKPGNVTDVMNGLQERGLVMPTDKKDNKKAWVITNTGEEYVQQMKV